VAILMWIDDSGVDLGGRCLQEQKRHQVRLSAAGWGATAPTRLSRRQDFSWVIRRARNIFGAAPPNDQPTFRWLTVAGSSPIRPWEASAGGPSRLARYHIEDDLGSPQSAVLWVTGKRVVVERQGGLGAFFKGVTLGVKQIVWRVKACEDPDFEVSLLLPWDEGSGSLVRHVKECFQYFLPDADADEAFDAAKASYFPSEPPEGWSLTLDKGYVHLEKGAEDSITLSVTAPTSGHMALALKLTEPGEEEGVISEIVELDVSE
jgi:hypothetical protein